MHEVSSDALLGLVLFQLLDAGLVLGQLLRQLLDLLGPAAVAVARAGLAASCQLSVNVALDSRNVAFDDALKLDGALCWTKRQLKLQRDSNTNTF